jgi:hypothetical protein
MFINVHLEIPHYDDELEHFLHNDDLLELVLHDNDELDNVHLEVLHDPHLGRLIDLVLVEDNEEVLLA